MVEIKHTVEIKGDGGASNARIKELEEALEKAQEDAAALRSELKQLGSEQTKKSLKGITDAIKGLGDAQKLLTDNAGKMAKSSENVIKSVKKTLEASVAAIKKASDAMSAGKTAKVKDYRIADRTLGDIEDKLTERQWQLLEKQLKNLGEGKISTNEFGARAAKISKLYSQAFEERMDSSTLTKDQRQHLKDKMVHDERMEELNLKYVKENNKETRERVVLQEKLREQAEKAAEALKKEVEQNRIAVEYQREQAKYKNREGERQERAKSTKEEAKAENERYKAAKNYIKAKEAYESAEAKEIRRQQKLAENERARLTLNEQLRQVMTGAYDNTTKATQKAELASKRLLDTMRHIQEFAATKGFTGTVGLESTDVLRAQQYYNTIMQLAIEWKRNNSEEGKAADMLGRIIYDAENFRKAVNRAHTALGQVASTLSAIAGIGKQFRQTLTRMVQPVTQMISQFTSSAFQSSLEALKNMELSEIGFGNFFGEYAVSGIMSNIKQNALLSPLSAAQLASYVNQIAPLSNGNATLATNAAMGVAKMIQYSGGEVTTEMEYVIRNLRDVISKGKATSIDIRQFNRAMPALKKVLQDMGLEDFLKDGELTISKETAPKLLEAFQKINESEDVGSIFDKTSITISGLMERMQEQIELLVIDVGEFSGATKWIKETLHDILEDTGGWLSNIKMTVSFITEDVMDWVRSQDWEHYAKVLGEVFEIFKTGVSEAFAAIKDALGGTNAAETLKQLAKILAEFIKGIGNSYAWLINIMKGLSNSGILGSGLLQGGMGVLGFMSGNAGTLITGLTRGLGNFLGVFNQVTTSAIGAMNGWQAKLLEAATTVNGFDEAIMLASQASTDLAADFALMQQMMNGSITVEEMRQKMEQANIEARARDRQIEARSLDRLLEARNRNIASEEAETAANERAAASELAESGTNVVSAGVAGATKKVGPGTWLGGLLGKLFKGLLTGSIIGMLGNSIGSGLSSGFGADQYASSKIGAGTGNIAGFASGGAIAGSFFAPGIGTAIGAIAGSLVGIGKTVFDIKSIEEEQRQDEIDSVKAQIDSGEYLNKLINDVEGGNRISAADRDRLNSLLVKWANNFNEAMPNGTADMLVQYLGEQKVDQKNIQELIKVAGTDTDRREKELFDLIAADKIEEANEYAQSLYELGYGSDDLTSMILGQAVKRGYRNEKLWDLMLQWGDVQTTGGADLTYEYIKNLRNGGTADNAVLGGKINELESLYLDVAMDLVSDMTDLDTAQKKEISNAFATGFTKFITGQMGEMTDEEKKSLTRLLTQANITDAWSALGLEVSTDRMSAQDAKKYGYDKNWSLWANDNIQPQITGVEIDLSSVPEDLKAGTQEYWDYIDEHWEEIAVTTRDKLKDVATDYEGLYGAQETAEQHLSDALEALGAKSEEVAARIKTALETIDNSGIHVMNPWEAFWHSFGFSNGGKVAYRAGGGDIRGVDTVPAMLQTGEFVMRKSAVDKIGLTALNALNTGNLGYFVRSMGRQNIYGDYSNARTWNNTNNDNRKNVYNIIKVHNNSKGARLNRYYSLANRLA